MKALDTWERILIALIVLVYLGFGLGIEGFFTPYALADTTYNFSEKALIALAMALLVIGGEIDLSIAATMALASMAMGFAMQAGAGTGTMVLAALATGAACGALNGWLVTRWKLPAIVVTIGTLSLYRGLAQVVLGDQAITGYPETLVTWGNGYLGDLLDMPWLIVPIEFVVMLVAALLVGLYLHATVHGRRIYAIGANPVTARFSGIAVDRYRLGLFVFAGIMAALAAVLLTGRIGSTRPNLAMGWELDAVTIVILGGVSIQGGRGSVVGTLLAAVLLGSFTFAMGMLNVTGIVVSMVVGGLLIVAMVLPQYLRRLASRFQKPPAAGSA
ncbi:MAG: branched-chain amino acid ABC transporter permease [Burkholderiales bacterium RIFCSPLOWO2_12_67_14]|jgi:rhamnose transport system permease protein|nr:MAG: branched-chain amino acid ABC transporter permease [Burkholderiales bacterium RIFCSPLOWO2_02_FULL_67_64]OGB41558.1 MAG: branched-chain amino acid ABC transporter permease [Burkholderiales bacterium RIFCSPHIGHO2_12_FULL_67_38]OGB42171.1 MAG: branched-chain amino acid ABC transporter permease [Burkholderiales bacterium RIFCSPLOWO2_12_67_14]